MRRPAIALLMILGTFDVQAQTPEDVFARGNEHYRAGQYAEAIKQYEAIVRQGYVSGPLLFNLGNAYYRSGNLARAILSYERASRIDPGDPDIGFNRSLVNIHIVDRIEPVPELFLLGWLRSLSRVWPLSTTVGILAFVWVLLFGQLAAVNILSGPFWNSLLRWGILVSAIAMVGLGAMFIVQNEHESDQSDAIIMANVVTAKNSPDGQSVDAFVIHAGLKVRVSDSVGDWVKISLADGKVGWIRTADFERI